MTKWKDLFGNLVNTENTLECVYCGYTLFGDNPPVSFVCNSCFWRDGVMLSDRVVCMDCACHNMYDGSLVTKHSHPDGFACDDCGYVTSTED